MAPTAGGGTSAVTRTFKGEATRARLLESASHLFAMKGYDATSVESIAAGADITAAGLYRYFETKESLLLAVARGATRTSVARRALGSGSLPHELAELFAEYLADGQTERRRLSIELSRAAATNEQLGSELVEYNRVLRTSLEETIAAGHPDLGSDPGETARLAHLLLVLLMGAIHLDTLDADLIGDDRLVQFLQERFRALLASGDGVRPSGAEGRPRPSSASVEFVEDEPEDGRRRRAARTRVRILGVAGELFARHGYDGTTTDQIAEAAGITVPGLYRHFDGKESLLAEVGRHTFARYRIAVPLEAAEDSITALADLVTAFSQPDDRKGRRLAVELDFGAWRSEQLASLLRDFHRQVRANVARSLLDDGVHSDPERADLAAMVALMVFMGTGHLDTVDPGLVGDPAWGDFLHRRMSQLVG